MEELRYPNNIAIIRRARGFSQSYIAEQIGVSRPKYIAIEKGQKELTVSQVNKLLEILDVDFEDLLGIDTNKIELRKLIEKTVNSEEFSPEPKPTPNSIKFFEDKAVRSVWDKDEEKWWFSVVDVVGILTEQPDTNGARNYWKVLKHRLIEEGFQLVTNCNQLKMQAADGKFYKTDVADQEQLFRIIQSVPSKKAEPFKRWLAKVGSERIDQMLDPEKSIKQALRDYRRLGYSDDWINQRLKTIEVRKDLTDTWDIHGVKGQQYATLTDIIYKTWAGKTAKEYKEYKGLKKENLRDNMTNEELVINMLAELSTTSITNSRNPKTFKENASCAVAGAGIAKNAREELESATGNKIVSDFNTKKSTPKGLRQNSVESRNRQ